MCLSWVYLLFIFHYVSLKRVDYPPPRIYFHKNYFISLMKRLLSLLIFTIISSIIAGWIYIGITYAINSALDGWRVAPSSVTNITLQDSSCRKITNSASPADKDRVIPTRTMVEWNAFSGAAPWKGITITNCFWEFETVWKTGTAWYGDASNIIMFNITASWSYTIVWGDWTTEVLSTPTPSHTYGVTGDKTINIKWDIKTFSTYWGNANYAWKLLSVTKWDNINWTSMNNMFAYANKLNSLPATAPNLSTVTDMSYMFSYVSIFNQPIGSWNTSNVTNMWATFYNATAFNQPIGAWNTANVTNMYQMFAHATSFNQPIGAWNTTSLVDLSYMFYGATAFNQPIGTWNTANVTNMSTLFRDATSFNQPIGSWNTANVTNMAQTFLGTNFNQPIGSWNTANVTTMDGMFQNTVLFNQPIGTWNTANVTRMGGMFHGATAFNQPIGTWNTAKVTDMSVMFYGATAFNQNLSSWIVNPGVIACSNFRLNATSYSLPRPSFSNCPFVGP